MQERMCRIVGAEYGLHRYYVLCKEFEVVRSVFDCRQTSRVIVVASAVASRFVGWGCENLLWYVEHNAWHMTWRITYQDLAVVARRGYNLRFMRFIYAVPPFWTSSLWLICVCVMRFAYH